MKTSFGKHQKNSSDKKKTLNLKSEENIHSDKSKQDCLSVSSSTPNLINPLLEQGEEEEDEEGEGLRGEKFKSINLKNKEVRPNFVQKLEKFVSSIDLKREVKNPKKANIKFNNFNKIKENSKVNKKYSVKEIKINNNNLRMGPLDLRLKKIENMNSNYISSGKIQDSSAILELEKKFGQKSKMFENIDYLQANLLTKTNIKHTKSNKNLDNSYYKHLQNYYYFSSPNKTSFNCTSPNKFPSPTDSLDTVTTSSSDQINQNKDNEPSSSQTSIINCYTCGNNFDSYLDLTLHMIKNNHYDNLAQSLNFHSRPPSTSSSETNSFNCQEASSTAFDSDDQQNVLKKPKLDSFNDQKTPINKKSASEVFTDDQSKVELEFWFKMFPQFFWHQLFNFSKESPTTNNLFHPFMFPWFKINYLNKHFHNNFLTHTPHPALNFCNQPNTSLKSVDISPALKNSALKQLEGMVDRNIKKNDINETANKSSETKIYSNSILEKLDKYQKMANDLSQNKK